MKAKIRVLFKIGMAFIIAFLIVNTICFGYNYLPKAFNRSANATEMIWNPGSYIIQCKEGIGKYAVDKNGFLNNITPDEKTGSYIVAYGASHTEGKEVFNGERYTDIINEHLKQENKNYFVYNIGMDGHFFDKLVAGFSSMVQEFSDAEMIILEVGELNLSVEEIEKSLEQRPYDEEQLAGSFKQKSGVKDKLTTVIKEGLPFINIAKMQFADYKFELTDAFGISSWMKSKSVGLEEEATSEEFYEAFRKTTDFLREEWNKELVILFHPSVELTYNGELHCVYPDNFEAFKNACMDSGLTFCDVGEFYISAWNEEYIVPRGFHNTTPGYGHINQYGHRIIADVLYGYIQEEIK